MARLFCGIVTLNGEELDRQVEQMASNLNFGNLYRVKTKKSKYIHTGHLFSNNVKEEQSVFLEKMKSRYTVVSSSMLIDREGLMKKLEISNLSEIPLDEELILRAFLTWGESCVDYLDGDWAFVIWDETERSLFIARNHHGDGTLYYYFDGTGTFYFSSLISGLIGIPNLQEKKNHIKIFMECMKLSGADNKTIFENRYSLLPAHYGIFTERGLKLHQYWSLDNLPPTIYKNEENYFEEVREIFSNAVEKRMSIYDDWAGTQSDGLDSAALTGLICQDFIPENEKFVAFSYIPNILSDPNKQVYRSIVEEMGNMFPSLELKFISQPKGLFDYINSYTETFGLPPYVINSWYVDVLSSSIKQAGYNQCFMAQGGNNTISFEGVSSFVSLKQLVMDIKDGLPISDVVGNTNLLLSSSKFMIKNRLKRGSRDKKRINKLLSENSLLDRDFLEEINAMEILEEYYRKRNKASILGKEHFMNKLNPGKHERLGMWNMVAAKYDLLFSDPTRDRELIEYCSTLPNHIYNRLGNRKYVYKKSFDDIVPKVISQHDSKRENVTDLVHHYKIDLAKFEDLLNNSTNDCVDLIDRKKLIQFHKTIKNQSIISNDIYNQLKSNMSTICMTLFGK